jgi:hypothetical protein
LIVDKSAMVSAVAAASQGNPGLETARRVRIFLFLEE